MARLFQWLLGLGFLGALALGGAYYRLSEWATTPLATPAEGKVVEFEAGTSLARLAAILERDGLVDSSPFFQLWVRARGDYKRFQAGKYRFAGNVTPSMIANTIAAGDVFHEVVLQITIPEGFPLKQVNERLAANGVGHIVELRRLSTDPSFLQSLNIQGKSLEGYLFPATYSFTEMPTAMQAFETMVKSFWKNLPKDYETNVRKMGLTLDQAVTFASLIELETQVDDERPLISEVIWRRLKDKVPLAIDAALIYGIADYKGDIKTAHLQDAKNPYNTRIHGGLPPSAIGAPGVKSLEAVLTPSNYGYYYYVLKLGTKRHHFSKTLKEHNEHVQRLIKNSRAKKSSKNGMSAQPIGTAKP